VTSYSIQTTSVVEIPTTVNIMDSTSASVDVVEVGLIGPQGSVGLTGATGDIGVVFQGSAPDNHLQLWADTSSVLAQVAVFDGGTPAKQLTSIKLRRGATADWPSTLVLDAGEFGYDSTANKFKIGNGSTTWGSLPYVTAVADLNNPTLSGTVTLTGATFVNAVFDGGSA